MLRRLGQITAATVLLIACDNARQGRGFVNVPSPGTHIVFETQPSSVLVGEAISPAVRIAVKNDNDQTVGSGSVQVTISIVAGSGAPGASLVGGGAQQSFGGIVNFTNLRIDTPGAGYQLLASATGFPPIASATFSVNP